MDSRPCRSCGKQVLWVRTKAGELMPLDPEPNPNGNIILLDGVAITKGSGGLFEPSMPEGPAYLSHFATCPHADQWRRKKEAKRAK